MKIVEVSNLYSWIALSRPRLFRIISYLEVKIWSLPKHEHLTTGKKKYCGKGEKLLLMRSFSSFPQYFRYISYFKSPIIYIHAKCGCSNIFFLNSANLICRGTDISKCLRESLEIRDNESRLYQLQNSSDFNVQWDDFIWASTRENIPYDMCAQQRLLRMREFTKSDQSLLDVL